MHNSTHQYHILKGDSGGTNHYVAKDASDILKNVYTNDSINVNLPDNTTWTLTHTGTLYIPQLSNTTNTSHILTGLLNTSLLKLGQLDDNGCIILLNVHFLHVFKSFELILKVVCKKTDGLWDIPIPSNKLNTSSSTLIQSITKLISLHKKKQPTKRLYIIPTCHPFQSIIKPTLLRVIYVTIISLVGLD